MKPETLRDVLGAWLSTEQLRYIEDAILDAHVYRSCPECGGIENHEGDCNACGTTGEVDGEECEECEGTGRASWVPCPACADAPVAIVDAALRERAGRAYWERTRLLRVKELQNVAWEDLSPVRKIELMEEADHILSTVLGHVRYAKEILYNATTGTDGNACATVEYFINNDRDYKGYRTGGMLFGDIAILEEEAGKEE